MSGTFMQWGADFLADTMAAAAGETVVYQRGERGARYPVLAVAGTGPKVTAQPGEVSNAEVAVNERDFVIRVCDFPPQLLAPDARPGMRDRRAEPVEGDWVTQTIGGRRYVFEVRPPTYGNEPAWRWADALQTKFRVHAKLLRVD